MYCESTPQGFVIQFSLYDILPLSSTQELLEDDFG